MLLFELIELLFNIGDLFNYFEEKKKKATVRSRVGGRKRKQKILIQPV
jgi:hypothetical protein